METNTKEYTPKAFRPFKIFDVVLLVFVVLSSVTGNYRAFI